MAGIKNKDILKCIGVKVQEARRNKNYTQEFVAEKVDRSIDTIRGIENEQDSHKEFCDMGAE